jgi:hypothetical protein
MERSELIKELEKDLFNKLIKAYEDFEYLVFLLEPLANLNLGIKEMLNATQKARFDVGLALEERNKRERE